MEIKGGLADNLHRVDGRLVLAGPRTDLCPPAASGEPCLAGYYVATVEPKRLAVTTLVKGRAHPGFSGASAGLPVGKTLWLGSFSANKLAYRKLP